MSVTKLDKLDNMFPILDENGNETWKIDMFTDHNGKGGGVVLYARRIYSNGILPRIVFKAKFDRYRPKSPHINELTDNEYTLIIDNLLLRKGGDLPAKTFQHARLLLLAHGPTIIRFTKAQPL